MTENIFSYRRRRERERRYEAEEALERRTYRTRNEYGEPRQMIGWSRESIEKWERETECKRKQIKLREGVSSAPTSTPADRTAEQSNRRSLRVMMLLSLVFGPAIILAIIAVICFTVYAK